MKYLRKSVTPKDGNTSYYAKKHGLAVPMIIMDMSAPTTVTTGLYPLNPMTAKPRRKMKLKAENTEMKKISDNWKSFSG